MAITARSKRCDDGLQALPLEAAEHGLAVHGEDLGQLHAAGALDLAVELDEGHGQRLRRELAERGLAGAAQADERDAALRRGARLAEALGDAGAAPRRARPATGARAGAWRASGRSAARARR